MIKLKCVKVRNTGLTEGELYTSAGFDFHMSEVKIFNDDKIWREYPIEWFVPVDVEIEEDEK